MHTIRGHTCGVRTLAAARRVNVSSRSETATIVGPEVAVSGCIIPLPHRCRSRSNRVSCSFRFFWTHSVTSVALSHIPPLFVMLHSVPPGLGRSISCPVEHNPIWSSPSVVRGLRWSSLAGDRGRRQPQLNLAYLRKQRLGSVLYKQGRTWRGSPSLAGTRHSLLPTADW